MCERLCVFECERGGRGGEGEREREEERERERRSVPPSSKSSSASHGSDTAQDTNLDVDKTTLLAGICGHSMRPSVKRQCYSRRSLSASKEAANKLLHTPSSRGLYRVEHADESNARERVRGVGLEVDVGVDVGVRG